MFSQDSPFASQQAITANEYADRKTYVASNVLPSHLQLEAEVYVTCECIAGVRIIRRHTGHR